MFSETSLTEAYTNTNSNNNLESMLVITRDQDRYEEEKSKLK